MVRAAQRKTKTTTLAAKCASTVAQSVSPGRGRYLGKQNRRRRGVPEPPLTVPLPPVGGACGGNKCTVDELPDEEGFYHCIFVRPTQVDVDDWARKSQSYWDKTQKPATEVAGSEGSCDLGTITTDARGKDQPQTAFGKSDEEVVLPPSTADNTEDSLVAAVKRSPTPVESNTAALKFGQRMRPVPLAAVETPLPPPDRPVLQPKSRVKTATVHSPGIIYHDDNDLANVLLAVAQAAFTGDIMLPPFASCPAPKVHAKPRETSPGIVVVQEDSEKSDAMRLRDSLDTDENHSSRIKDLGRGLVTDLGLDFHSPTATGQLQDSDRSPKTRSGSPLPTIEAASSPIPIGSPTIAILATDGERGDLDEHEPGLCVEGTPSSPQRIEQMGPTKVLPGNPKGMEGGNNGNLEVELYNPASERTVVVDEQPIVEPVGESYDQDSPSSVKDSINSRHTPSPGETCHARSGVADIDSERQGTPLISTRLSTIPPKSCFGEDGSSGTPTVSIGRSACNKDPAVDFRGVRAGPESTGGDAWERFIGHPVQHYSPSESSELESPSPPGPFGRPRASDSWEQFITRPRQQAISKLGTHQQISESACTEKLGCNDAWESFIGRPIQALSGPGSYPRNLVQVDENGVIKPIFPPASFKQVIPSTLTTLERPDTHVRVTQQPRSTNTKRQKVCDSPRDAKRQRMSPGSRTTPCGPRKPTMPVCTSPDRAHHTPGSSVGNVGGQPAQWGLPDEPLQSPKVPPQGTARWMGLFEASSDADPPADPACATAVAPHTTGRDNSVFEVYNLRWNQSYTPPTRPSSWYVPRSPQPTGRLDREGEGITTTLGRNRHIGGISGDDVKRTWF